MGYEALLPSGSRCSIAGPGFMPRVALTTRGSLGPITERAASISIQKSSPPSLSRARNFCLLLLLPRLGIGIYSEGSGVTVCTESSHSLLAAFPSFNHASFILHKPETSACSFLFRSDPRCFRYLIAKLKNNENGLHCSVETQHISLSLCFLTD